MKAKNNHKIGIITFHRATNLGAALQASALVKFINRDIAPCELIDFVPNNSCGGSFMQKFPLLRKVKNNLHSIKNIVLRNRTYKFDAFRKKEMVLSDTMYYGDNDMLNASGKYSVLISGSDQILNTTLSGTSKSYYLHFDDNAKKISYASSFGRTDISETEKDLIKTELSKFHAISVREYTAGNIIKREINKDSILVVDPVFLLEKEEWLHTCNAKLTLPKKYIFVYSMEVSKNLELLVEKLQTRTTLPVIVVRGGGKPGAILGTEDTKCGPREFIRYIANAEYVITNSFHGTAMSLILGKKFISVAHSTRNARLQNILNMVNAEEKLVPFDTNFEDVEKYVNDGEMLYPLLDKHIKGSKEYLANELN